MSGVEALIWDLSLVGKAKRALRKIFDQPADDPIRIKYKTLNVGAKSASDGGVSHFFAEAMPDIVLFIFSQDQLSQAKTLLESCRQNFTNLPVIAIIEDCKNCRFLDLLNIDITDFVVFPFKRSDIIPRIWKALRHPSAKAALKQKVKARIGLKQLIGRSKTFVNEIEKIPLVRKCDASVLITGETGTGKELCARALHYTSTRSGKPFVAVDCGAIPVDLIENELFGHVRGAFTGANPRQAGLVQKADDGTLFLDEIHNLSLHAQTKLLRLLQEKEYRPLGSAKTLHADVRIIAATNSDPEKAVDSGKLRSDLFYRLNVIPLRMPPLRERRDDIPLLARHFLEKYISEYQKPVMELSPKVLQKLMLHEWPGNVRELENIIERTVVFSNGKTIEDTDIRLRSQPEKNLAESFKDAKARSIEKFEKEYIHSLLLAHNGNITSAAKAAQKNRRAFWELLRKNDINVQSYKKRRF